MQPLQLEALNGVVSREFVRISTFRNAAPAAALALALYLTLQTFTSYTLGDPVIFGPAEHKAFRELAAQKKNVLVISIGSALCKPAICYVSSRSLKHLFALPAISVHLVCWVISEK